MKSSDILVISGIAGAQNLVAALEQSVGSKVQVASSRQAGLACLKRGDFAVIVVEENLVEADPDWADQLWQSAGLAIPLQVNFAIKGSARLGREVKTALARRDAEYQMARRVAAKEMESELKGSLTGLLLQSELALREPQGSESLRPKLQLVVELAAHIRDRFERGHE